MVVSKSLLNTALTISMVAILIGAESAEAKRVRIRHTPDPINVCRMVPPNTQGFDTDPFGDKSTVDEGTFNAIMDAVQTVYGPLIAQQGARLVIDRLWKNDEANAYADRPNAKTWNIHMFGGLARHPFMTPDGMLLVACHELGHHMGGAPTYTDGWHASAEGEADYYGTLKCMKLVLRHYDNTRATSISGDPTHKSEVTPQIQAKCQAFASNVQSFTACERSIIAGQHLAAVLTDLENQEDPQKSFTAILTPQVGTPDRAVVQTTLFNSYPGLQCRFDTYIAGASCPSNPDQVMDDKDPSKSACVAAAALRGQQGDAIPFAMGTRPLCWFNPNSVAGLFR